MTDIHSCSYYCTRPDCVLAQRDEMRDKLMKQPEPVVERINAGPVGYRYKYPDGGWRFSGGIKINGCDPIDSEPVYTHPAVKQQQAEPVAEPVMIYHGECTIDCGNHGHHNVELLKLIAAGTKLYAGPQQQAEPVALMDSEIVHFAQTALHEMPRPATDWHHCAKRVCEAVVAAQPVQAEPVWLLGEYRLWDSQWTNVVNHANAYANWDKADAINHAVRMTEAYMARNVERNHFPPRQAEPVVDSRRPAGWVEQQTEPVHGLVSDAEYLRLFEKARNGSDRPSGKLRGIRAVIAAYEDAAPAKQAEPVDLDQQVRDITAGVGLPPVESPVVPDPVIDCDCGQRWCWTDDAGWNPKQAEPEPLTVAEIEQMEGQWNYEIHGDRTRYLVRMTEKAHAIKGAV